MRIGASAHNFPSLSMRAELVREEYLYEPDGSLLTKGFREIYHTALKKPFMLKHFLYDSSLSHPQREVNFAIEH